MYTTNKIAQVPYLVPIHKDEKEDEKVQEEYKARRLGICASLSQIEEEYGLTLRLYFEYMYVILLLNVVLCALRLYFQVFFLLLVYNSLELVGFLYYIGTDYLSISFKFTSPDFNSVINWPAILYRHVATFFAFIF